MTDYTLVRNELIALLRNSTSNRKGESRTLLAEIINLDASGSEQEKLRKLTKLVVDTYYNLRKSRFGSESIFGGGSRLGNDLEGWLRSSMHLDVPHVVSRSTPTPAVGQIKQFHYADTLSYQALAKLSAGGQAQCGAYGVFRGHDNSNFIGFTYVDAPQHANSNKKYGWKFHISIDNSDQNNMAKAWEVVRDILIKHKIANAKCVRPGYQLGEDQRGKEITLYAFNEAPGQGVSAGRWQAILQEITNGLAVAGVRPGEPPRGDLTIPGSTYCSYRNDENAGGGYSDVHNAQAPNPYKNMVISQQGPHLEMKTETNLSRSSAAPFSKP